MRFHSSVSHLIPYCIGSDYILFPPAVSLFALNFPTPHMAREGRRHLSFHGAPQKPNPTGCKSTTKSSQPRRGFKKGSCYSWYVNHAIAVKFIIFHSSAFHFLYPMLWSSEKEEARNSWRALSEQEKNLCHAVVQDFIQVLFYNFYFLEQRFGFHL